jgi:hypothetical protein
MRLGTEKELEEAFPQHKEVIWSLHKMKSAHKQLES